jgi:arginase
MRLSLIAVPYDSGRRLERMGAGPRHLLERGLPERLRAARHEVEVIEVGLPDGFHTEVAAGVALMRRVAAEAAAARAGGRLPVVLSGNCGIAVGTVSALGPASTGVLWFDAHGDLNTPATSPSGFFDGMGYAMLLGHGWGQLAATVPGFAPLPATHAALLAARDLDPGEHDLVARSGLLALPPARLREAAGREALAALGRRVDRLYVHVDLDALDPRVIRANYLPTPGGLEPEEVVAAAGAALAHAPLGAVGVASYDPREDERDPGPEVVAAILLGLLEADPGRAANAGA